MDNPEYALMVLISVGFSVRWVLTPSIRSRHTMSKYKRNPFTPDRQPRMSPLFDTRPSVRSLPRHFLPRSLLLRLVPFAAAIREEDVRLEVEDGFDK